SVSRHENASALAAVKDFIELPFPRFRTRDHVRHEPHDRFEPKSTFRQNGSASLIDEIELTQSPPTLGMFQKMSKPFDRIFLHTLTLAPGRLRQHDTWTRSGRATSAVTQHGEAQVIFVDTTRASILLEIT
ncbi:hypothetical protein, partial [Nonomuraea jabiensis]|uniref:hypothetical protein n=1 Tax=Nonomuraea jabiensis TaxID=882448 RepID=UPI0036CE6C89